jgi:hypothetical protein
MPRDLRSAAYVRQLIRAAEEKDGAPAYLRAAPGILWWVLWLFYFVRVTGGRDPTAAHGLGGIVVAVPLLILSFVTVAWGIAVLLTTRARLGPDLLAFAINVSGPMLILARS